MSMGINEENATVQRDMKQNWQRYILIVGQNEDSFSSGREDVEWRRLRC
jgi:hypothetical protein